MRTLLSSSTSGVIFVSLRINEAHMSSSITGHTARRTIGTTTWSVSWLGHRQLTRNEAVTALTLAELVSADVGTPQHKRWPLLQGLATELNLHPATAICLIREKS